MLSSSDAVGGIGEVSAAGSAVAGAVSGSVAGIGGGVEGNASALRAGEASGPRGRSAAAGTADPRPLRRPGEPSDSGGVAVPAASDGRDPEGCGREPARFGSAASIRFTRAPGEDAAVLL